MEESSLGRCWILGLTLTALCSVTHSIQPLNLPLTHISHTNTHRMSSGLRRRGSFIYRSSICPRGHVTVCSLSFCTLVLADIMSLFVCVYFKQFVSILSVCTTVIEVSRLFGAKWSNNKENPRMLYHKHREMGCYSLSAMVCGWMRIKKNVLNVKI